MKDKIIEILQKNFYHQNINDEEKVADEILALFEERIKLQVDINDKLLLEMRNMYPKKFIEWCLLDVGKEYVSFNSDKLHYFTIPKTEEIWFDTIDEIYDYWLKNLKK
jgi:hypothetical protein